MTTMLHLIRHGQTDWNLQRRFQGQTDIPLNAAGLAQAAALVPALQHAGLQAVHSSPLARALETAQILARGLGTAAPLTDPRLMERNYGAAEGLPVEEVQRRFPVRERIPGYESNEAIAERALPALTQIAESSPASTVAVIAHGGIIRTILNLVTRKEHPRLIMRNCSVHTLIWQSPEDIQYLGEFPQWQDGTATTSKGPVE